MFDNNDAFEFNSASAGAAVESLINRIDFGARAGQRDSSTQNAGAAGRVEASATAGEPAGEINQEYRRPEGADKKQSNPADEKMSPGKVLVYPPKEASDGSPYVKKDDASADTKRGPREKAEWSSRPNTSDALGGLGQKYEQISNQVSKAFQSLPEKEQAKLKELAANDQKGMMAYLKESHPGLHDLLMDQRKLLHSLEAAPFGDNKNSDIKNADGKNGNFKNGDGKNGDSKNGDGKKGDGTQSRRMDTPASIPQAGDTDNPGGGKTHPRISENNETPQTVTHEQTPEEIAQFETGISLKNANRDLATLSTSAEEQIHDLPADEQAEIERLTNEEPNALMAYLEENHPNLHETMTEMQSKQEEIEQLQSLLPPVEPVIAKNKDEVES